MEKKFWQGLLLFGIVMHILASMLMPLGLDAHVHATYVSDEMDDGEAHLEWGELRPDSPEGSTPEEVSADDKWLAWHSIIEMWFTIFSPSIAILHIMALIGGLGCLATIFLFTRDLFGQNQALRLTALASIYPPLIRAAGRFYQEGIIVILVVLATYSIVKALRDKKSMSNWWIVPLVCALIILSFKGMPLWYVVPAVIALLVANRLEMNQIHIAIIAIFVEVIILYRNGIPLANFDIIPALLSAFIGYFIFVYCGMLLFTKQDGIETNESISISRGSSMIAACLVGWIAALWVTEASALEANFFDIIYSFRNNPRYLSLLIIPLWYSRLLRTDSIGLSIEKNRNILVATICLLLVINASVLVATGERGTEVVGVHLGDEIGEGEDILFIANTPLSMQRMYSVKFAMDPDSDGDNLGFWRHNSSDWHTELLECDVLKDVNWIINYPTGQAIAPEGWIEVEFDGSDRVDENYHLYTWGGENEHCA
jgi:hypothetical protein